MSDQKMLPVNDPSEVPDMTDEEATEFWATHYMTEEYIKKNQTIDSEREAILNKGKTRTKNITIRMEYDTYKRLQTMAKLKGKPYQSLLKQFVEERLYMEEQRNEFANTLQSIHTIDPSFRELAWGGLNPTHGPQGGYSYPIPGILPVPPAGNKQYTWKFIDSNGQEFGFYPVQLDPHESK